jgi:hypothetical protein
MRKFSIACLLLLGCQQQAEQPDGNTVAPRGAQTADVQSEQRPGPAITTLAGLYEGRRQGAGPVSQMCMVDPAGEVARFGLVVWGANDHSCSGSGTATRSGDRLQLKMTGDEACTIDARIEGDTIVLPDGVSAGCAYYCGARARLDGARLSQVGTGGDDAAKAKDLVGDPLC